PGARWRRRAGRDARAAQAAAGDQGSEADRSWRNRPLPGGSSETFVTGRSESRVESREAAVLSRVLVATALAAALVSGGALAFLRTDFVANNLCAYAVATIEEATAAQVRLARCSVDPARGQLVIDGLQVGDPGGRIDLRVARI